MALNLEKMHTAAATQERVPEGTYMSRISALVDCGIQPMTDYKTGAVSPSKPRFLITWCLPTEKITITHNDGEEEEVSRYMSKEYTASNDDRSLIVKLSNELIKGDKNLLQLLDLETMLSVGSTNTGNAKVVSCVKAPKGMPVPALENPAVAFDFDEPEEGVFKGLAPWIQSKIMGADNYNGFADSWVEQQGAA
jgi:hypothetical protein